MIVISKIDTNFVLCYDPDNLLIQPDKGSKK